MVDWKKVSDDELWEALDKKYGEDWDPKNVDSDDPLVEEFLRRISLGE